jgi:Leucine-rich repeat (LRR) protein
MSNLIDLNTLDMSQNKLTYLFDLRNMLQLKTIYLHENSINTTLPTDIFTAMTQLTTVVIRSNKFFGPLPMFANLTKLETLDVSGNMFMGQIDVNIFNYLSSLKFLSIQQNSLSGLLPNFIGTDNIISSIFKTTIFLVQFH